MVMVMAHGLNSTAMKRGPSTVARGAHKGASTPTAENTAKTGIGSRRIFPPHFKLQVLDSYRNDADCKGNQRATARKYGIHRRQIQKWLQAEANLRSSVTAPTTASPGASPRAVNNNNQSICNRNVLGDACADSNSNKSVAVCVVDVALERRRQRDDATGARADIASPRVDASECERAAPVPLQLAALAPVDGPQCGMPMDLSVKRATGAASASAPVSQRQRHPAPIQARAQATLSLPALLHRDCRERSRSRSPHTHTPSPTHFGFGGREPYVPNVAASSSCIDEIWDLSIQQHEHKKLHVPHAPPLALAKPLFKPYLLDDDDKTKNNNNCSATNLNHFHTTNTCFNNGNNGNFYTALHPPTNHVYENMDVGYVYDESGVLQPATPYLRHVTPHYPQQRHSYSLNFKLRAIDSYYRDECCKGNQRAVAFKFNIHRRQIQKWLKQEEELRERNERHLHVT